MKATVRYGDRGSVLDIDGVRKLAVPDRSTPVGDDLVGHEVTVVRLVRDTRPDDPRRGVAFFAVRHDPADCASCARERQEAARARVVETLGDDRFSGLSTLLPDHPVVRAIARQDWVEVEQHLDLLRVAVPLGRELSRDLYRAGSSPERRNASEAEREASRARQAVYDETAETVRRGEEAARRVRTTEPRVDYSQTIEVIWERLPGHEHDAPRGRQHNPRVRRRAVWTPEGLTVALQREEPVETVVGESPDQMRSGVTHYDWAWVDYARADPTAEERAWADECAREWCEIRQQYEAALARRREADAAWSRAREEFERVERDIERRREEIIERARDELQGEEQCST